MKRSGTPATLVHTAGFEETEELGRRLGKLLPRGSVVGLVGPLGSGKTTFVRGLAGGLGLDSRQVCSPSFLSLVEYRGGRFTLHHADLYRFSGIVSEQAPQVFLEIGLIEAMQADGITAVEWWEHYRGPCPELLVTVELVMESVEDRSIRLLSQGSTLAEAMARLAE